MIRLITITASIYILLIASCTSKESEGKVTNPILNNVENIEDNKIRFDINPLEGSDIENQLTLFIDQHRFDLATLEKWRRLEKEEYQKYQIPEQSTDAIMETETDFRKVFYVFKQTEENVVAREGVYSEGTDSISYKAIAAINSMDLSPDPEINYSDLVGAYGTTDGEKLQLLILGIGQRKNISAVLYSSEADLLPSKTNIAEILKDARSTPLKNFNLNVMERSFTSESYAGKYRKEDGEVIIIFKNMIDKEGLPREFKKLL